MTNDEVKEILYPNVKLLTFDEGFEIYKKFYRQSIECNATINVEGFEPILINGYRIYDLEGKELLNLDDEVLKFHYQCKLDQVEGEYI